MFRPGDRVQHFVIGSLLGEGGMGQVFVARDTRLNRQVAVKIMSPEEASAVVSGEPASRKSDGAARLLREAQSAAALEHPNVVTIYEVGEVEDPDGARCPFIAMELVKGKPLRAYCGDESVPMRERVRWVTDIARALAAAHEAGLVHRDIKPENVMIRDDGVVKVLDFGLAKRAARTAVSTTSSTEAQVLPSITAKGVAVGTPYYMAPEQMRREALDGRADQFSWGVLAYELLSGEPPWGRDVDALELVSKLLSEHPPPLEQVRPDVPPHVAAVVMRALEKKRADRFESTRDMVDVLVKTPSTRPADAFAPTMPRIPAAAPAESAPREAPTPAAQKTTRSERPAPRQSRRAWALGLGALALVAISVVIGARVLSSRDASTASSGAPSSATAPSECTSAAQCIAKASGKPARCVMPEGRCAALESEDCVVLASDRAGASDKTIWIGTLYPRKGPQAEQFGLLYEEAADLGRREYDQVMSGLIDRGEARPVGIIACDDAQPARAVRHLVEDVGVPAIIGFRSGEPLRELIATTLAPHGALAIVTLSTDSLVTRVPIPEGMPRLVWRVTESHTALAEAAAAFVESHLETRARAVARVGSGTIRVAYVRPAGEEASAISQVLLERLRFNGKGALENGRDYADFALADDVSATENVERLRRFAPHLVLYTQEKVGRVAIEALERSGISPVYVTASSPDVDLVSARLNGRFYAVLPVAARMANARFTDQFNATFPEHRVTRELSPSEGYDAFYMLLYATLAIGDGTVDGRALSRSFDRILGGAAHIAVGTSQMFDAFEVLKRGGSIDLEGATGTLDFDRATGEVQHDIALVCVARDPGDDKAHVVESGVVLHVRERRVTGELRCP